MDLRTLIVTTSDAPVLTRGSAARALLAGRSSVRFASRPHTSGSGCATGENTAQSHISSSNVIIPGVRVLDDVTVGPRIGRKRWRQGEVAEASARRSTCDDGPGMRVRCSGFGPNVRLLRTDADALTREFSGE